MTWIRDDNAWEEVLELEREIIKPRNLSHSRHRCAEAICPHKQTISPLAALLTSEAKAKCFRLDLTGFNPDSDKRTNLIAFTNEHDYKYERQKALAEMPPFPEFRYLRTFDYPLECRGATICIPRHHAMFEGIYCKEDDFSWGFVVNGTEQRFVSHDKVFRPRGFLLQLAEFTNTTIEFRLDADIDRKKLTFFGVFGDANMYVFPYQEKEYRIDYEWRGEWWQILSRNGIGIVHQPSSS